MTVKKTFLRPNPFCEFEERFQNSNPQIEKKRSIEQQREIEICGCFFYFLLLYLRICKMWKMDNIFLFSLLSSKI